jgi:hypothetical protein
VKLKTANCIEDVASHFDIFIYLMRGTDIHLYLGLVHPVALVFQTKIINRLFVCSQLIVSLLYTNYTTCFGYTAILRCITYIKMLKLLL